MSEKRKNHYVPKHLLREFSFNGNHKQIGVFNLNTGAFIEQAQLKNQAQENFFYGKDNDIEDWLSRLETDAAPVLKQITQISTIPKYLSKEYLNMFYYVMILGGRTKFVEKELNQLVDNNFQLLKRHDTRLNSIAKDVHLKIKNAALLGIETVKNGVQCALDLKCKVIVNRTKIPFIISDHPVVKRNSFLLEKKFKFGKTGLLTKGLQIFLPISPTTLLIIYDNWCYKIGDKKSNAISITNSNDIDGLNMLQLLYCNETVYFNHNIDESYIKRLYNRVKDRRVKELISMELADRYSDSENMEHIIYRGQAVESCINLALSFIKLTKKAKGHILSDFVVQLRNENLRGRIG